MYCTVNFIPVLEASRFVIFKVKTWSQTPSPYALCWRPFTICTAITIQLNWYRYRLTIKITKLIATSQHTNPDSAHTSNSNNSKNSWSVYQWLVVLHLKWITQSMPRRATLWSLGSKANRSSKTWHLIYVMYVLGTCSCQSPGSVIIYNTRGQMADSQELEGDNWQCASMEERERAS